MTTRLSILTLALIGVAGLAQAQSPAPAANTPLDPNGRPYVGAGNAQRSPGDPGTAPISGAKSQPAQSPDQAMGGGSERYATAFKDEYGFRYNSRGDRLDANGHIMPPPVTPPGAAALR
jgi:hypothetical protein